MINDLQVGPFADELCMNPPTNMNELRQQAAEFIQMENIRKYKDNVKVDTTPAKKKEVNKELVPRSNVHPQERKLVR